jgi:hypothetical protein
MDRPVVHAGQLAAAAGNDHDLRERALRPEGGREARGVVHMTKVSRRTWGTLLFILGLALALAMAIAAIWGDFEAVSYFNTGANYAAFGGLHCPVILSQSEAAQVSATFDNPTDKASEPYYQVKMSGLVAPRSFENQLQLQPHSSTTVRWTVSTADEDLGSFVMVKITVLPFAGNPARAATCGMIVFNFGKLTGGEVLPVALVLSLLAIVGGLTLREGREQPESGKEGTLRNGMRATGVAVLLAVLTGFLGMWLVGLIFSAITILLSVILLRIGTT